jgi:cobalamin biosynthesis protein CobD/CbiB
MLNKVKNSKRQRMSELAITSGIMSMIPVVFISFGANFVGVKFSSTNLIFYILISTFVLYSFFNFKESKLYLKIKLWKNRRQFLLSRQSSES